MQFGWQTSWGVSTRLIGAVIMTHGDDSGLILPPRVAPFQVVMVPIPRGDWRETVLPHAERIKRELEGQGVRVMLDDREEHSPGWKYAEWEMRGVPLRLEIGPRDIKNEQVMLARRDTREKMATPMNGLSGRVAELLRDIQQALFDRAVAFRAEHTLTTIDRAEFDASLEGRPRLRRRALVRIGRVRNPDQDQDPGDHPQPAARPLAGLRRLHPVRHAGEGGRLFREVLLAVRGVSPALHRDW